MGKYATSWVDEWKEMPEFDQKAQRPFSKIVFRFETEEDLNAFSKLIGQKLTSKTKSAWYPALEKSDLNSMRWSDES